MDIYPLHIGFKLFVGGQVKTCSLSTKVTGCKLSMKSRFNWHRYTNIQKQACALLTEHRHIPVEVHTTTHLFIPVLYPNCVKMPLK